MSAEQVKFIRQSLTVAILANTTLNAIAKQVASALERTEGGSWLCLIKPLQNESGLAFKSQRTLELTFTKNGIEYLIDVA